MSLMEQTAQETLCRITSIVQSERLSNVIHTHLGPQANFNFKDFSKDLINSLKKEFPQRVEELRYTIL